MVLIHGKVLQTASCISFQEGNTDASVGTEGKKPHVTWVKVMNDIFHIVYRNKHIKRHKDIPVLTLVERGLSSHIALGKAGDDAQGGRKVNLGESLGSRAMEE